MLGGGPCRFRCPRILRSLCILYLLVSMLVNRTSPTIPTVNSGSPVVSVRVHHLASINESTFLPCQAVGRSHPTTTGRKRCLGPICFNVETTFPAQISPSLSSSLLCLKRLSHSPVSVRVRLSQQSALSPTYMGLRVSISHTYIDPFSSSSWLNSSDLYRNSSISLCHLEKVPTRVLCSGHPEALVVIPDEHLSRSSLILDATSIKATHTATSSLSLWFDFISVRLCSSLWKPEKSTSETSGFIPVLSLLVGHSKGSYSSNTTGVCKLSHRYSRQDRYNLTTPIVLNLNPKFIVDIGALHGFNSVMVEVYLSFGVCIWRVVLSCDCSNHHCPSSRDMFDFHKSIALNLLIKLFLVNFGLALHGFDGVLNSVVTIVLSPILSAWRLFLIFDQVCYRVRAAFLNGFYISVSFSRSILEVSLVGLQRYTKLTAVTFGFGDKLERTRHMKWDFGLCLISSASLISEGHSQKLPNQMVSVGFKVLWPCLFHHLNGPFKWR